MKAMTVADDVSLSVLEDEGVFFCAATQQIHLFNTPATYLWCCLEQRMALEKITDAYAETFGVSREEADRVVSQTLAVWSAQGYLRAPGSPRIAPRTGAPRGASIQGEPTEPGPAVAAHVEGSLREPFRQHTLRLLGTSFALRFAGQDQEQRVWPTLTHLAAGVPGPPDSIIEIPEAEAPYSVRVDDVERLRCSGVDELAPAVKGELWRVAVDRSRCFMQIHAGAVLGDGGCLLLPGAAGQGKTTLTTALVAGGYRYLSDEAVLLHHPSMRVDPVPLGAAIKSAAVESLAGRVPRILQLPEHRRADGVTVRYLSPDRSDRPDDPGPYEVRALIFPAYTENATTELRAISRPDALRRLLEQCLLLPEPLDGGKVSDLVAWMRGLECFELPYGELDRAVEAIDSVGAN